MYDAENRRFVALDPIMDGSRYDISERVTDPVMFVQYLYVKNMPLIATDPLGLMLDKQAGDSNSNKRTAAYTVTANNVNMRLSAGLQGTAIRQVNKGDTLTALGEEVYADGYYWAKIQFSGVTGWVAKTYLRSEHVMPGASNHSDKQLQLNEQKHQNTVSKIPDVATPKAKTDEVSPWDSTIQDIEQRIEQLKYEFEQTITHYANVATALGQVFTDEIRGEDFERGLLTSIIIDSGAAGAQMIQALAVVDHAFMPWLPEVDFYKTYLQSGDAFDEYALSLSHYWDSYYLGRMIGDTVAEAFGLGMSVAAVIEMIGGGAAAVGGTITSGTGIGAVIGVAGAAITAEGVVALVSGEAIAAAAAANHGTNSGKFDKYFEKEECGGESDSATLKRGKSRAPEEGTPGSVYEQIDQNGNVVRRTTYGSNGKPAYRDDLAGKPHFDKASQQYLMPHRHWFNYNEIGQPIGETVTAIPD